MTGHSGKLLNIRVKVSYRDPCLPPSIIIWRRHPDILQMCRDTRTYLSNNWARHTHLVSRCICGMPGWRLHDKSIGKLENLSGILLMKP